MSNPIGDAVPEPDEAAADAARRRHSTLAEGGSLGRLEDVAVWSAAVQGRCPPVPFHRVRVVVFAGDHAVSFATGSPEVTAESVRAMLGGTAPVSALARFADASVRVFDFAVDGDTSSAAARYKVRRGSGRIDVEDALDEDEVRRAFEFGTRIADEEIDAGAELLIPADLGSGGSIAAATMIAAVTDAEPVDVAGWDPGADDAAWMRKVTAIRDALRRTRGWADGLALLRVAGGADFAAMSGFLARSAVRRTPALISGVVPAAVAVVTADLAPGAAQWWLAGQLSPDPGDALALSRLRLDPVLELRVTLGQAAGALLALPLVNAAIHTFNEIAPIPARRVPSGRDDG